jgi:cyclohexyl-isocyanide hydratase
MPEINVAQTQPLELGAIIFPGIDQADFTGPFEVLSRLPNSRFHILAKELAPVRDARGLVLTPEKVFADAPQLDLLLVPGGGGINALLEDYQTLDFIRRQATRVRILMSVCTGALVCGAAGLLKGRKATTHWASHHFLQCFGAIPINERVVVDGTYVSAAGVTAGFDGALTVAALLRGERVAREIQLYLQYAPEPPFDSGSPETASAEVLAANRAAMAPLIEARRLLIERLGLTSG